MFLKRFNPVFAALVILSCSVSAHAQRESLELGDQAPGLDVEVWLGPEVSIQNGFTYVVLFFSTQDSRIEQTFNMLSKLYEANKSEGLNVFAVADEEEDVVRNYVQRLGDFANFPVAVDRRGSSSRNWIGASELEKTPAVFLVDKRGILQYIGDPLAQDFGDILELVVTKRYDAKLYKQADPAIKAMKTARRMRNWRMCLKYLDDLIDTDNYAFAPKVLDKFEVLLVDMGEKERAYEYAREVMVKYATDFELLYWLAEKIVEDSKIPDDKRDLDVALELVQIAAPQIDANDPDRYSTIAKVHFHRGEFREAVQMQRKAYLTSPPLRKENFEKVLRTYMEQARRSSKSSR